MVCRASGHRIPLGNGVAIEGDTTTLTGDRVEDVTTNHNVVDFCLSLAFVGSQK